MYKGFVRVASATPEIKTGDVYHNKEKILECMRKADKNGCDITIFPELVLTGSRLGDLFLMESLIVNARMALEELILETSKIKGLFFVGLPMRIKGELYNALAGITSGELIGVTIKKSVNNKYFSSCAEEGFFDAVMYGENVLYQSALSEVIVGAEIGSDAFSLEPPAVKAVKKGASIIVNASSIEMNAEGIDFSNELASYTRRLHSGYVLANGSLGDSTTDMAFERKNYFFEDGQKVLESEEEFSFTDINMEKLLLAKNKDISFRTDRKNEFYCLVEFEEKEMDVKRKYEKTPFAGEKVDKNKIFSIQVEGLKKRIKHVKAEKLVIGISGGLDSTLALLVMCKAFDDLGLDRKGIIAVTMPCFGTTKRTKSNAQKLAELLNVSLKEINIKDSVLEHFKDINHDVNDENVAFENAQARERTQVLMDLANDNGGFVVGTGDMSELALGWATYNGDQMSMYGVNAGVPKTIVKMVTELIAKNSEDKKLREVLLDVVATPVSPELLPSKEDDIHQKTEDIVGPYILHDFFLYHLIGEGLSSSMVFNMAKITFKDEFKEEEIYKWLRTFIWRFFAQQYKRSAMPDGPKVFNLSLSPRSGFVMPSDCLSSVWISELEKEAKK